MAYRTKATECIVHLVRLRLTEEQAACERLRREAGRCWSDLVRFHHSARIVGEWPSVRDLEIAGAAGRYFHPTRQALHLHGLWGAPAPRRQRSRQYLLPCADR